MNAHKKASFNEKASDHNTYFHRAIRKHGWDAFVWEVIYTHPDSQYTKNKMEPHFISEHDSYNNGYNMTLGGDGAIGLIRTKEHRAKIGAAQRGKPKPKLTEEHKNKLSQFMKNVGNSGQFKSGDKRIKAGAQAASKVNIGKKWWSNGNQEIKAVESPGPEWINSRLPSKRPPSRKGHSAWNKGLKSVKT